MIIEIAGTTLLAVAAGTWIGAIVFQSAIVAPTVFVDLDEAALEATADECRAAGAPRVQGYTANVAKEAEVEALFDSIAEDFGEIHGLVNNAGIIRDAMMLKYKDGKQVAKMTLDQWQAVIDVNLNGAGLTVGGALVLDGARIEGSTGTEVFTTQAIVEP